jgi:hypothetical protein
VPSSRLAAKPRTCLCVLCFALVTVVYAASCDDCVAFASPDSRKVRANVSSVSSAGSSCSASDTRWHSVRSVSGTSVSTAAATASA